MKKRHVEYYGGRWFFDWTEHQWRQAPAIAMKKVSGRKRLLQGRAKRRDWR